jgi:Response regulator containing a CheY-like receiver domain and an HTH DNA-binding domain
MIKVAMADDHMLVINGLQKIFSGEEDIVLTGTYTNGEQLLAGLQQQEPDVLLLDIQMPGKNGIELAGIISKKFPNIRIIALSNIEILHQVKKMMKQGCSGYLLKDVDPATLISAVHQVYEGYQVIHEKIKAELTGNLFGNDNAQVMTRREIEILQLIAEEYTNPQIAEKLHISPHTVENHRNHMLQKLGVKNTAGLIRKAMEQGLI